MKSQILITCFERYKTKFNTHINKGQFSNINTQNNTLVALITFLKKCEKNKRSLYIEMKAQYPLLFTTLFSFYYFNLFFHKYKIYYIFFNMCENIKTDL